MIEFLRTVKARADELGLLRAPFDAEDRMEKILDGLGDDYQELMYAVQARDTSVTFEELHEKLLNFEASLLITKSKPVLFPATSNPTSRASIEWRPPGSINTSWRPSSNQPNRYPVTTSSSPTLTRGDRPSCPYIGYCQICRIQGYTAKGILHTGKYHFNLQSTTTMLQ